MIKAQAIINGVISRAAEMRTTTDGQQFIALSVKVNVPGSRKELPTKAVFVSVSKDGDLDELAALAVGTRIEASGVLTFRKGDTDLYLNFRADSVTINPDSQEEGISGTLEFRGTVGQQVEERADKKGRSLVVFPSFSIEKQGETFRFTWVRLVWFDHSREPFLQPKAKIQTTGKLLLTAYNDRLSLECHVATLAPLERQPAEQQANEQQSMSPTAANS